MPSPLDRRVALLVRGAVTIFLAIGSACTAGALGDGDHDAGDAAAYATDGGDGGDASDGGCSAARTPCFRSASGWCDDFPALEPLCVNGMWTCPPDSTPVDRCTFRP